MLHYEQQGAPVVCVRLDMQLTCAPPLNGGPPKKKCSGTGRLSVTNSICPPLPLLTQLDVVHYHLAWAGKLHLLLYDLERQLVLYCHFYCMLLKVHLHNTNMKWFEKLCCIKRLTACGLGNYLRYKGKLTCITDIVWFNMILFEKLPCTMLIWWPGKSGTTNIIAWEVNLHCRHGMVWEVK